MKEEAMKEAGWKTNKNIVVIFNTVTWIKGEQATADNSAALKSYRGEQRDLFQSWTPSSKDLNAIIIITFSEIYHTTSRT